MILVVGGLGSGKKAFVQEQFGYGPADLSSVLGGGPVLCGLQDLTPLPDAEALSGCEVVICDEIGCGVVPVAPEERARREAVGRLCCELARRAEQVYRVNCGIGMRLK